MSGIVKMVHRIDDDDGPYKTISEVAEYFERDKDTIRRWAKTVGVPNHKMPLGDGSNKNAFVWLYTEEDVKKLEAHSETIRMGRPPRGS